MMLLTGSVSKHREPGGILQTLETQNLRQAAVAGTKAL
jgi:hypothetical protein